MGCRNVCKPPIIYEHVQEAYPRKSDIRQTQIEISALYNSRERLGRGHVKNSEQLDRLANCGEDNVPRLTVVKIMYLAS